MKNYSLFLGLALFVLFSNGSCEHKHKEDLYFITIQNNSDQEIIDIWSMYFSIAQDSLCFKPSKRDYWDFMDAHLIEPHSSKKSGIDFIVNAMQRYPEHVQVLYIGVFNRIDMDTMSCEVFEQKYPIKKEWKVTLEDLEACNFDLVLEYTPEE